MRGIGYPPIADEDLPGGAKQLLVAARKAGGWFCWVAGGVAEKGRRGEDGMEVVVVGRCLVKGRHGDGRAWVVRYVDGKVDCAYHLTHHHSGVAPGPLRRGEDGKMEEMEGEVISWDSDIPTLDRISIADLKRYIQSPQKIGGTPS